MRYSLCCFHCASPNSQRAAYKPKYPVPFVGVVPRQTHSGTSPHQVHFYSNLVKKNRTGNKENVPKGVVVTFCHKIAVRLREEEKTRVKREDDCRRLTAIYQNDITSEETRSRTFVPFFCIQGYFWMLLSIRGVWNSHGIHKIHKVVNLPYITCTTCTACTPICHAVNMKPLVHRGIIVTLYHASAVIRALT